MKNLATRKLGSDPDAIAPDGSEVRILVAVGAGSMAHFTLRPGAVSRGIVHRSVEEVWFFTKGRGTMWRRQEGEEEIVEVGSGVSIAIPVGASFQFRAEGEEPLEAVGVTMPPWPGPEEAVFVEGPWAPTA